MKTSDSKALLYLIRKVKEIQQELIDTQDELAATQEIVINLIKKEEDDGDAQERNEL